MSGHSRNLISHSSLMKPLLGRPFLLTNYRNLVRMLKLTNKEQALKPQVLRKFSIKDEFCSLDSHGSSEVYISNLAHRRCKLFFSACSVNRSSLAAGLPLFLSVIIFWHFFLTCIVFIYNISLVTLPITFTTF